MPGKWCTRGDIYNVTSLAVVIPGMLNENEDVVLLAILAVLVMGQSFHQSVSRGAAFEVSGVNFAGHDRSFSRQPAEVQEQMGDFSRSVRIWCDVSGGYDVC